MQSKEEALLGGGGGGGGFSHPLSLKFRGQLSFIPKITETVIPKTTYLWNFTIGGNENESVKRARAARVTRMP